jgi:hypothetical protein
MRPTIQFINYSTVVPQADLIDYVAALQIQITRDVSPYWNINPILQVLPPGQAPSAKTWWHGVFDTADQAGYLGFHDYTTYYAPLAKSFAKTDLDNGASISVTLSHENIEICVDPWVNALRLSSDGLWLYAEEPADAIEADALGYEITLPSGRKILVSDFQTPAWFGAIPSHDKQKFDFMNHCPEPFQVLPGGYAARIERATGKWQDVTVDGHNVASRKSPGSRYHRRREYAQPGKVKKPSTVKTAD